MLTTINHNPPLHDNVSHETESLFPLIMTHYRLHNYTVKLAFPSLIHTNHVRRHFSLNSDNGQTSSSILRHHPSRPSSPPTTRHSRRCRHPSNHPPPSSLTSLPASRHPLRPSPPPHHRPQSRRVGFHCRHLHLLLLVKVSTGHSHHPLLLHRWRL